MAYTITPGPHPQIMIMEIHDNMEYDHMFVSKELGMEGDKKMYILLDVSRMNAGLPDGFLEGAKRSYFTHDNLAHMALYAESALLQLIGNMVAKVTRRKEQLSIHESHEKALAHLQSLVNQS